MSSREISQEYWRPAQAPRSEFVAAEEHCDHCGTQFAAGARFCHVCGGDRAGEFQVSHSSRWFDALDFSNITSRLGMSATSLVLTIIAAACVMATIMTGVIYSASTLTEWQAVQTWRMEWLMAAAVALLAAILFKNNSSQQQQ